MFTKTLLELSKRDGGIAGGKGSSLGEMTKAGIAVPAGFVVLASAFERFLRETDLNVEIETILHTVKHTEMHTVEHASEKIRALILNAPMPVDIEIDIQKQYARLNAKFVAVRSSATAEDSASAAWAGQLDTFLNTSKRELLNNVQKCWASLFTPRALFYRFEKGLHTQKISVAVVVQKMIESEVSGIAFSVHPVTEDRNQLIIEAGFGLGEAIVSGQITPDSYVVEKQPRRILDTNISKQEYSLIRTNKRIKGSSSRGGGTVKVRLSKDKGGKQKLSDTQILELSELILNIEHLYGFPCDIEWAFAEGKFYILQSRPITTLTSKTQKRTERERFAHISSDTYDFLWTVGFPYLYCSMYLESGYTVRDFIAINHGRLHTLFVSKKERKRLSEEGFSVFTTGFEAYTTRIKREHALNEKRLDEFFRAELRDCSNEELVESFRAAVQVCIKMWAAYFVLEYHSSDKVSEALLESGNNSDLETLRKRVDALAKVKLRERKNLNKTLYSPNIFEKYFSEIERRVALKWDIHNYSYHELINALLGKDISHVPDRSGFVARGRFSNGKDIVGKDAEELYRRLQRAPASGQLLRGIPATKGNFRGRVKCIHFSVDTDFAKDIADMKKGDVLVSGSTGPELMLACKKAGAIVTDEGGIISHAAIISRELGIPCIIGTKIATKVLKDGDVVEVDANKGVVKIIKRAS